MSFSFQHASFDREKHLYVISLSDKYFNVDFSLLIHFMLERGNILAQITSPKHEIKLT